MAQNPQIDGYNTKLRRDAIRRIVLSGPVRTQNELADKLKEAGFDIASSHQGSFLAERLFDDSELHLLIDSVLASRHISAKHSRDLIDRLTTLSSRYFKKRVRYVSSVDQWEKTDNKNLFYNIEIIDEAIEQGKMVQYI